jgi:hypothetical protein
MDQTLLTKSIRGALLQGATMPADADAIAEAMGGIWHLVSAQLVPLIGVRGLDVLFRRALDDALPGIATIPGTQELSGDLPALVICQTFLRGQSPSAAIEASTTVLVRFTDLLAALIGHPVTKRLLGPIWGIGAQSQDHDARP